MTLIACQSEFDSVGSDAMSSGGHPVSSTCLSRHQSSFFNLQIGETMKQLRVIGLLAPLVLCFGMAAAQDAAHDVNKGAAKTVQAVKHTGKKVGNATKSGAKGAGNGTKVVAKDSAKGVKKATEKTGAGIKDAAGK
jgi:hypothetical protein